MLSTCSQWADCPSQCILPPHLVSGLLVCWAPAGPGGFLVMSSQLLEVLPPGFPSAAPTASFFCAGRSGGAEDLAQERVTSVGRAARLLPFSWHYHQTFLLPLKFGFLVGTLEAHSSFQQLSGNKVVQGKKPDASFPRCFDWVLQMEISENPVQGHACPSESWHVGLWGECMV